MSLLDGIASGVRSFFGIPQPHHNDAAKGAATKPATKTAKDSKTTFSADAPAKPAKPSLKDRIGEQTLADRVKETKVGPHESADRSLVPPSQGLADAFDAAGQVDNTGAATERQPQTQTQAQPAVTTAKARVFDASQVQSNGSAGYLGSTDSLDGQGASQARTAADNVQQGLDYYASTFGRNGIDNAGAGVDIVLNDTSTDSDGNELFKGNGGYYTSPNTDGNSSEAIRFGSGIEYQHQRGGKVDQASMLYAEDLTIHELTHGLIKHETGQVGGTANEAGSVNEAFADVMAASATRDWRMGESMYMGDSDYKMMRNIANPDDPTAVHSLWTDMSEVRSAESRGAEVEEHFASGVLSTAAARIQHRLGGENGWKAVEQVFYDTITEHRLGDMSFTTAAQGLRTTAAEQYGTNSQQYAAFDTELQAAGL